MHSAVVEFHALADADRAGAEYEHFLFVGEDDFVFDLWGNLSCCRDLWGNLHIGCAFDLWGHLFIIELCGLIG